MIDVTYVQLIFIKYSPVRETSDLTITNKPYHTKLQCDKAERKDSAVYRIVAKNQYGMDEADVEVTVVSKPSKPEGPLEVSDVNKNGKNSILFLIDQ